MSKECSTSLRRRNGNVECLLTGVDETKKVCKFSEGDIAVMQSMLSVTSSVNKFMKSALFDHTKD